MGEEEADEAEDCALEADLMGMALECAQQAERLSMSLSAPAPRLGAALQLQVGPAAEAAAEAVAEAAAEATPPRSAARALAAVCSAGDAAAADAAVDAALEVGAVEMDVLLQQLREEPEGDEERAAKFRLYEQFAETITEARTALLEFWAGVRADFEGTAGGAAGAPGGAGAAVERSLRQLDGEQNCVVHFNSGRWFVHDMLRQADANNRRIDALLNGIKTKLELLARQSECPICLEPLGGCAGAGGVADSGECVDAAEGAGEAIVLSCCHKVCAPCWRHWVALKGQRAFCPLCRSDEFLGNVVEGHGVPPALFRRARDLAARDRPSPAALHA